MEKPGSQAVRVNSKVTKMKITLTDGETFKGRSALDVVTQMKGASMFTEQKNIEEYIRMVVRNAWRYFAVGLEVTGDTEQEMARSLIRELVRNGLATKNNGGGKRCASE